MKKKKTSRNNYYVEPITKTNKTIPDKLIDRLVRLFPEVVGKDTPFYLET